MQKHAPSIGRIMLALGFALSCFGLLLFLWVTFGGPIPLKPKSYRFTADFPEGITFQTEADVRIGGVSVGKVKAIELPDEGSLTRATIELEPEYAPISEDARAILRSKTLLGETYVELTSGSQTPEQIEESADDERAQTSSTDSLVGDDVAEPLAEDGHLDSTQVVEQVQIDEIFNALDEETRLAFRAWQQNLAVASKGRGVALSDAFGNLGPFTADANKVLETLDAQEQSLSTLVNSTGTVFGALTEGERELTDFIQGNNRTFGALAARDKELAEAIKIFPTFNEEGRKTLARLEKFSVNARPLARDLKPVARNLTPTFRDLRRFAPHAQTLFRNLDPLITSSEKGLPALRGVLRESRPVLRNLDPFLANFNPILRYMGLYEGNVTDFLANPPHGISGTLENIGGTPAPRHALRQISYMSAESLSIHPTRLSTNRGNGYVPPNAIGYLPSVLQDELFPSHDCDNTGSNGPNGQVLKNPPTTPRPTSGLYPLGGSAGPIAACTIAPDFSFFDPSFAGAGNVPYVPRDP